VNNAGVCDFGHVEWCGVDVYNRLLQVNTLGTIRVTQAFLPLLRKKRGSRVVIVASVAGIILKCKPCKVCDLFSHQGGTPCQGSLRTAFQSTPSSPLPTD
jgi:hypothetical protein